MDCSNSVCLLTRVLQIITVRHSGLHAETRDILINSHKAKTMSPCQLIITAHGRLVLVPDGWRESLADIQFSHFI